MTLPVLYLDTCALNRLTDNVGQPRLFAEAAAMTTIMSLIQSRQVRWVASILLVAEISRNPNARKRLDTLSLLPPEDQIISPTDSTLARARELAQQGLASADALHVALAEQAYANWFITTDDRLLRRTADRKQPPECINPVDWLRRRQPWLLPKP